MPIVPDTSVEKHPPLPYVKLLGGGVVNQSDPVSLAHLARFNNVILDFVDRDSKVLKGEAFQVKDRKSVGGLSFKTIRVADDLSKEEYSRLTEAINPDYKEKPFEEILVTEGVDKSLLQIQDAEVKTPVRDFRPGLSLKAVKSFFRYVGASISDSVRQKRLTGLRESITTVQELFDQTEKEAGAAVKADLQAKALELLHDSVIDNLPHEEYVGPVLKNWPSPRRTLSRLDAICSERTSFAHALLGSKLETYPVNVLVDYTGEAVTHTCLLCRLADGGYFLFDANMPGASGRLPREALGGDPFKKLDEQKIVQVDVDTEAVREKGFNTTPHLRLQVLDSAEYLASVQYTKLGRAYVEQGDSGMALSVYNRAVELNPSDASIHFNIGDAYMQEDDPEHAVFAYSKAVALNPSDADAYKNIGVAYERQGKLDKAAETYEKALEIYSRGGSLERKPGRYDAYANLYYIKYLMAKQWIQERLRHSVR